MEDGVVAAALEVVLIADVKPFVDGVQLDAPESPFSPGELAYARAKRDPLRRLAARLAAKRATARLLGSGFDVTDAEVQRDSVGPPRLVLSERARRRVAELGAERVLVSLTHGREHAAAAVLFLAPR